MTNLEFKARLRDPGRVQQALRQRGASLVAEMRQTDTYFQVPRGRLKLREIEYLSRAPATGPAPDADPGSMLIFYERQDTAGVRRSEYQIVAVADAGGLRSLLAAALGVRQTVHKKRVLHLLGYHGRPAANSATHIRIHLDHVEGLGNFVEVEALAGEDIEPTQAEMQAQALLQAFGLQQQDLLAGSYADMLESLP